MDTNYEQLNIENLAELAKINLSSEELNDILDHKPNNQFTEPKPKTLFNRFSSFFSNEKPDEKKLEPSLSLIHI